MPATKYCVSIAGLDPSGGAGILSDVKTFEALGVQGFGISTATTYQNEHTFSGLSWLGFAEIVKQLDPLFDAHEIGHVKIGLIESWEVLKMTLAYLKEKNPEICIVWDPILASSSGFTFHSDSFIEPDLDIFNTIDLFTPNIIEMEKLFPQVRGGETGIELSMYCSVLLKGGHGQSEHANDILFHNRDTSVIHGARLPYDKHGTGCVLSAAIVAHLAKGNNVEDSCNRAKNYVNTFLNSNTSLLGSHSPQKNEKAYS